MSNLVQPTLARQQSGIALITVLLFLVLITVAGAIAVRQGLVDLNVSTSDQAGTLMLNNSDSVLAHIEQAAGTSGTAAYNTIMSQQNGVLGYFILNGQEKIDHQLLFCYQGSSANLFDRSQVSVWLPGNSTIQGGTAGVCNPSQASHYTSNRATAMTQIGIKGLSNVLTDNFEARETGTSADIKSQQYVPQVLINSVSVLPAMSSRSDNDIRGCLGRPMGDVSIYGFTKSDDPATQNMNACLKTRGIPANSVVEEGVIKRQDEGGYESDSGDVVDACTSDDCKNAAGL